MKDTTIHFCIIGLLLYLAPLLSAVVSDGEEGFVPLFPQEGVPQGWLVRRWNDIRLEAPGIQWQVKDGILHGSTPRGPAVA